MPNMTQVEAQEKPKQIGLARATDIINAARAKDNKDAVQHRSVRALLRRNGFTLTQVTPHYLTVDESELVKWIEAGGYRSPGKPAKTR